MKKLLSLLCAASLALSLAACGASADTNTNTNTTEPVAGTLYSLENATVLTFTDSGITAQDGSDTGYEIDGTPSPSPARAPTPSPAPAPTAPSP